MPDLMRASLPDLLRAYLPALRRSLVAGGRHLGREGLLPRVLVALLEVALDDRQRRDTDPRGHLLANQRQHHRASLGNTLVVRTLGAETLEVLPGGDVGRRLVTEIDRGDRNIPACRAQRGDDALSRTVPDRKDTLDVRIGGEEVSRDIAGLVRVGECGVLDLDVGAVLGEQSLTPLVRWLVTKNVMPKSTTPMVPPWGM